MSVAPKEVYAASCNPSRRAKRPQNDTPNTQTPTDTPPPVSIRPYTPRSTMSQSDLTASSPPPPPAKRGRKPGPLSRSAREAQRRLNHSIIEKARRTKINDALATLKQLVPIDYGKPEPVPIEDEDEDDDDAPQTDAKSKPKPKSAKREEKEKEFKLEILVRTVTFLQDLLKRVETLEKDSSSCANCAGRTQDPPPDRKRTHQADDGQDGSGSRPSKRRATKDISPDDRTLPSGDSDVLPSDQLSRPIDRRLPSISTWLSQPLADPVHPPNAPKASSRSPASPEAYLPTPPSSTRFDPIRPTQYPPNLILGPVATMPSDRNAQHSHRTSEDENAATLLLQISTSPPFRPVSSPASGPTYGLTEPSHFRLQSDVRTTTRTEQTTRRVGHHAVQTPGSLLGLSPAARTGP